MQCRRGDIVCAALNFINIKFCTYCRRKSYAQVSMDIALLVVNAAHLTRILRGSPHDNLRTLKLILVSVSIVLEVLIAILIFLKERYDIYEENNHRMMEFMNNFVVYVIFASVVIHVFVSVFVEDHYVPHYLKNLNRTECGAT